MENGKWSLRRGRLVSKNVNFDIKGAVVKAKKTLPKIIKHAPFMATLLILAVYLFSVWRISQLASAEPPPDQQTAAVVQIPKIDENVIKQIQALEQSNTEIKSLFNSARNNPFLE